MDPLKSFQELISTPKKVVITTHHKPDADALGSSLGLKGYLVKLGHSVEVIAPSDYPKFLNWMPDQGSVINFEAGNQKKATELVNDADIIFCLDFSALSRINDLGPLVRNSSAKKVLIDHHLEPEIFADFVHWNPEAAATCELIYELITNELNDHEKIDISIAECLYAGILTDTGSFRHPCTSRKVHEIIADLIGIGVSASKIQKLIYDNNSAKRLKFLGYILSEKMVVMPEYHTAYITINRDELKQFESETGDTEGFVNYALSIEGIVLAAIIVDRTEAVKISFRSVGPFKVNSFARTHFEGGGHGNAAGGKSNLSLENTVEKFLNLLPVYQPELEQVHQFLDKNLNHKQ